MTEDPTESFRDREIEALIVAYVDDELSPKDRFAFEQRLRTDEGLVAALQEFVTADELGRALGKQGFLSPKQKK